MLELTPPEIEPGTTASDGLAAIMHWLFEGANDAGTQDAADRIGLRLVAVCKKYCPETYEAKRLDKVFPQKQEVA